MGFVEVSPCFSCNRCGELEGFFIIETSNGGVMLKEDLVPSWLPLKSAQEVYFIGRYLRHLKQQTFNQEAALAVMERIKATIPSSTTPPILYPVNRNSSSCGVDDYRTIIQVAHQIATKHLWTRALNEAGLLQLLSKFKQTWLAGNADLFDRFFTATFNPVKANASLQVMSGGLRDLKWLREVQELNRIWQSLLEELILSPSTRQEEEEEEGEIGRMEWKFLAITPREEEQAFLIPGFLDTLQNDQHLGVTLQYHTPSEDSWLSWIVKPGDWSVYQRCFALLTGIKHANWRLKQLYRLARWNDLLNPLQAIEAYLQVFFVNF